MGKAMIFSPNRYDAIVRIFAIAGDPVPVYDYILLPRHFSDVDE